MLELRVQRGLASLDNKGAQLANQIGRNSRVLPALTYTCTDLHISHPGIYNSNLVARQGETVARTSASQCTPTQHHLHVKPPLARTLLTYMCTVLTYTLAKDAYATDIHVYGTDIHPGCRRVRY